MPTGTLAASMMDKPDSASRETLQVCQPVPVASLAGAITRGSRSALCDVLLSSGCGDAQDLPRESITCCDAEEVPDHAPAATAARCEGPPLPGHDAEYDAVLDESLAQIPPDMLAGLLESPPAQPQRSARYPGECSDDPGFMTPAPPHQLQRQLHQQQQQQQQQQQGASASAAAGAAAAAGPHSHVELHLPTALHPGLVAPPVPGEDLTDLLVLLPLESPAIGEASARGTEPARCPSPRPAAALCPQLSTCALSIIVFFQRLAVRPPHLHSD